ncbi:MAG: hypothetical protein WC584_01130 [Candidatus Pacearchaeota archaeon]
MKKQNICKEFARDFLALGSIPFFVLVLVRIWIIHDLEYLSQFAIAGGLFLILTFLFKSNLYSGLSFVILVFTILFYNDKIFTIFAVLVYLVLICSLVYLNYEKKKISYGFLFGVLSTGIGYYIIKLMF